MTKIRLYDLTLRDDRRPSPFCWCAKYALAHKGLDFEAVPVKFTEIPKLFGGAYKTVPILEDEARVVGDSWAIADYLDEAYADRPPIFGSPTERQLCRFVEAWIFMSLGMQLLRMYVKDIHDHACEEDRAYFRKSREERLGCSLEEACAGREGRLDAVRAGFEPIRFRLAAGAAFISGERPGYADYVVGGVLLWIASVGTLPLLRADDPLLPWFERVQDLYGGLGRKSPLHPIAG